MASQHRKIRGYKTQRNVAQYLKEQGWNHAYSIGAGQQGSDIQGLPFDVEVKARKALDLGATVKQIKTRSKGLGFAVARLNGQGDDASKYIAFMDLETLVKLLKQAGWDKVPIGDQEPIRCQKCGAWKIMGVVCQTCQNITFNA